MLFICYSTFQIVIIADIILVGVVFCIRAFFRASSEYKTCYMIQQAQYFVTAPFITNCLILHADLMLSIDLAGSHWSSVYYKRNP